MMPSAKASSKYTIGYLVWMMRKGGAIASGLGLTLSIAWHCAQFARTKLNPRCSAGLRPCAPAGSPRSTRVSARRTKSCAISVSAEADGDRALRAQRSERCGTRAIVAPGAVALIRVQVAFAACLGRTLAAHALKVANGLRLGIGNRRQTECSDTPFEQIG